MENHLVDVHPIRSYEGAAIVLEPGDATRYEIAIWLSGNPFEHINEIYCIAVLGPKNNSAFKLAKHSLEQGWESIVGKSTHDRIGSEIVQWLAHEVNLNLFTAAAVYEAWHEYKAWSNFVSVQKEMK